MPPAHTTQKPPFATIDVLLQQRQWRRALSALDTYLHTPHISESVVLSIQMKRIMCLRYLKCHAEAIALCRNLHKQYNNTVHSATICGNMAVLLRDIGAYAHAARTIIKAIRQNPQDIGAWMNLGVIVKDAGHPAWAQKIHQHATARNQTAAQINPDILHWNYALSCLTGQHWHDGWQYYEHGIGLPEGRGTPLVPITHLGTQNLQSLLQHPSSTPPSFQQICILTEQGIGDEIMFAAFIPRFLALCAQKLPSIPISFVCRARMLPIYRHSFPNLRLIPRQDCTAFAAQAPKTCYIPIGSLPLLTQDFAAITHGHAPYLKIPAHTIDHIRQKYQHTLGKGALFGISWFSRTQHIGKHRDIPLHLWHSCLQRAPYRFVSLQYGLNTRTFSTLQALSIPAPYQDIHINPLENMFDFAAQTAAMDHIFTIDTSTAHLAGALGIPCQVLLPYAPDWRWSLGRSRWYRSVTLHKKTTPADAPQGWRDILSRLHGLCRPSSEEEIQTPHA
jgi:tetratricopeptide (TPR) repeat protein